MASELKKLPTSTHFKRDKCMAVLFDKFGDGNIYPEDVVLEDLKKLKGRNGKLIKTKKHARNAVYRFKQLGKKPREGQEFEWIVKQWISIEKVKRTSKKGPTRKY